MGGVSPIANSSAGGYGGGDGRDNRDNRAPRSGYAGRDGRNREYDRRSGTGRLVPSFMKGQK